METPHIEMTKEAVKNQQAQEAPILEEAKSTSTCSLSGMARIQEQLSRLRPSPKDMHSMSIFNKPKIQDLMSCFPEVLLKTKSFKEEIFMSSKIFLIRQKE